MAEGRQVADSKSWPRITSKSLNVIGYNRVYLRVW